MNARMCLQRSLMPLASGGDIGEVISSGLGERFVIMPVLVRRPERVDTIQRTDGLCPVHAHQNRPIKNKQL